MNVFSTKTKLSYYKVFDRISISDKNEGKEILMNSPVCLGLSILESSKMLMYEFGMIM